MRARGLSPNRFILLQGLSPHQLSGVMLELRDFSLSLPPMGRAGCPSETFVLIPPAVSVSPNVLADDSAHGNFSLISSLIKMKTLTKSIHHPSKHALLMSAISLSLFATSANAQTFGTDEKGIGEFFTSYLEKGQQGQYDGNKTIADGDVESAREMVWKAWADANNAFEEEKLMIETMDLTQNNRASWTLPSEGGMKTVMPFYYGFKGDDLDRPEAGWPLFVYLHGSGGKDKSWQMAFNLSKSFDDKPSVYFIPQIPNDVPDYNKWYQKSKQYAWEKLLRLAFVRGDIDANRVYFLGFSEGGFGSQRLASFYADYLAGAGPMAGGEPLINAPSENLRHTAFFMRTGSLDEMYSRNALTMTAKDSLDALEKRYPGDYVHNVQLEEGADHGSVETGYTTPYLKQFSRNPFPKHVNWENMDMDGVYRKGFYNICVTQRTESPNRMYLQMDINGNDIDLNVTTVGYKSNTVDETYNVVTSYLKTYTEATDGKIKLYLSPELVDFDKPVTIRVNGREVYSGKIEQNVNDIVNSCATFFDPKRLYTASVDIDIKSSGVSTCISKTPADNEGSSSNNIETYDLSGVKAGKDHKGIAITSDGRKVMK